MANGFWTEIAITNAQHNLRKGYSKYVPALQSARANMDMCWTYSSKMRWNDFLIREEKCVTDTVVWFKNSLGWKTPQARPSQNWLTVSRPKKKRTMFSVRSDIQKWCGDAGFFLVCWHSRADGRMYSHTYKECFRLNKMFYSVGQNKLALGRGGTGGGKKSDVWGSNLTHADAKCSPFFFRPIPSAKPFLRVAAKVGSSPRVNCFLLLFCFAS